VVHVNNAGCALMSRGAFENVQKSFSDAGFVMKECVCQASSSTVWSEQHHMALMASLNLRERIQQCDQRLASPQVHRSMHNSSSFLLVLQLEDFTLLEVEDILQQSPCPMLCPIHLEEMSEPDAFVQDQEDPTSVVVLCNLGLSCACPSKLHHSASQGHQEFRSGAVQFSQLADSILHGLVSTVSIEDDVELWKTVPVPISRSCMVSTRFSQIQSTTASAMDRR